MNLNDFNKMMKMLESMRTSFVTDLHTDIEIPLYTVDDYGITEYRGILLGIDLNNTERPAFKFKISMKQAAILGGDPALEIAFPIEAVFVNKADALAYATEKLDNFLREKYAALNKYAGEI